jgi:pimeloyl-ACP methyl ester carboxylesterase
MKMRCLIVIASISAFMALPAQAAHPLSSDITLPAVALRPGVTADLHVRLFTNGDHACHGRVALAVHGMLHTANTWDRFAEALFEDNPAGRKMCRIFALNMPGHGGSGLPDGISFGELTIEDYVTALLGTLDRLAELRVRPDTLFGHSLGGLVIQAAQQRLIGQGTNFRGAYGIKNAVLFASAAPVQIPLSNYASMAEIMAPFFTWSPALGYHLAVPDPVWAGMLFTNFYMQLVDGAPTAAEVAERGYNAPAPMAVAMGVGLTWIAPGIFAPEHKTMLQIVTYGHDPAILPNESLAVYEHLTGDITGAGYALVGCDVPESVHEMHISSPGLLLESIAGRIRLP